MSFVELLLLLSAALPPMVYISVMLAGVRKRRPRVTLGSLLCLVSAVGGAVIRWSLVATLPATSFATAIPVLNLGQTVLSLAGWLLIASAALDAKTRQYEDNPTAQHGESGNPYVSIAD